VAAANAEARASAECAREEQSQSNQEAAMKHILTLTFVCLHSFVFPAFAAETKADRFYNHKTTLSETMLATRAKYAAWLAEQKAARAAVACGPWSVAGETRPGWKDGTLLTITDEPSKKSATLTRSLTARKAVTLTVGLGGGDKIEVRLNDKPVATLDTKLELKRYGTSMRPEGDRRNQVLLDLPLAAGENRLAVSVTQQRIVPRREPIQLFFSPTPDPVPALWARLRRDFPPAGNRLLEAVSFNWFESGGWLDAANGARLEKEFLASLNASGSTLQDCVAAAEAAALRNDIAKLRLAVTELGKSSGYPAADFLRRLDAVKSFAELDRCKRQMLVEANPLLKGRKIIFARRFTYDSQHYYDDYYHGPTEWGGNLTELDLATGKTRDIVPALSSGIFDRYDLSHDGKRVVFGYRACKPDGYRIWEQQLDGSGLRQLTFRPADEEERVTRHSGYTKAALEKDPRLYGHWTDDMHPCYLPDGRIVFVSSRSECTVLCGGHSLTCTTLHRMDADGRNLRQLSQGALTESTPTMLDDGRILYTRWEYVYKGIAAVQSLWAMRPDGTGSEEIYGHNIDNPGVFFAGRQIPGRPDHIVAAGVGHEPLAVGSIRVIDRNKDRRTKDAMTSLTPEVETRGLRGLYQFRNGRLVEDVCGSFYGDPYPLSEKFFLVSHAPDNRYNDPKGYGIWLLDAFGNRVLIHQDPAVSCFQPMLLAPRAVEPELPVLSQETGAEKGEATVLLVDLYRRLQGVKPGTIKYLRVMEQIPRSWVASQIQPGDAVRGQNPAISLHTHIWVGVLLGVVPVEEDGSVLFKVPARRNIFFTALDKDFMEVQKMRTFVNFQPGETRSCIGCHDPRDGARAPEQPLAMLKPPRVIGPQPGDTGARPIHYPSDVQPVLDKHCVRCHSGDKPKGNLDLTGEMTEHFNRSYENLLRKSLVNFIQEWTSPEPDKSGPSYASNGSMLNSEAVPPYTYGSHKSRLIEVLRKGHHDVALAPEEFIRLVTWVDANAPFYGSYFGRRHIAAKGRPDFRPVPTLDSARGVPPPPYAPPPLPAELLASWTRGDLPDRFDGKTFVPGKPAGAQQAVSVALWVRADELNNTWNPLLFTDGSGLSSLHFSLLKDGTPNVAVNYGGKLWMKHRANTAVAPGAWRHVAVVCDPRIGGVIRFYLDGQPAGSKAMDLGVPLDMAAYRLGAWKNWEQNPANNFHGALDDVRLYRGTLTDAEVAALAQPAKRLPRVATQ
jgi:hypothetical protein